MGYEVVAAAIVGGVFSILGILFYQRGTWKKLELEHAYNIKRFKLGKKYKLKEKELPKKSQPNWLELAKKLDKEQISSFLDMLPDNEEYEEGGDIGDIIAQVATSNPELVQSFIGGLTKNKQEKPPEQNTY